MKRKHILKLAATSMAIILSLSTTMIAFAKESSHLDSIASLETSGNKYDYIVDGSISNSSSLTAISMHDGKEKLDCNVTVTGDISVDNELAEGGLYDVTEGITIESEGGIANVDVAGDVTIDATKSSNNPWATGISTTTGSTIDIGGDLSVSSNDGTSIGIHAGYPSYDSPEYDADITIDGDVKVTGGSWVATGINILEKYAGSINIGGDIDVSADNGYASGICIKNEDCGENYDGIEINVGGDISATGIGNSQGVGIFQSDREISIIVDGDITASGYGAYIYDSSNAEIIATGTMSPGILVKVDKDKTEEYIPDITAWKVDKKGSDIVAAYIKDIPDSEYADEIAKSINYIIKQDILEDGKKTSNAVMTIEGASGNVMIDDDTTYDTAHQGEELTIKIDTKDGYSATLYNGDTALTANDDGTYTFVVPAGGGIDLIATVIQEEDTDKKDSTPSDADDDSDIEDGKVEDSTPSDADTDDTKTDNKINNITKRYSSSSSGSSSGSSSRSSIITKENNSYSADKNWAQDSTGWKVKKTDGRYASNEWYLVSWNGQNNWYHFDQNGYAQGGWFADTDGKKYYLYNVHDGNFGAMMTGWHMIDGIWYFFNNTTATGLPTGALLANTTTPDGYKVDATGAWIK